MKLNWGTGIAIFYTVFVLALVYQVWKSTTYDNSLVSDEYYQEDLDYQQHYNKLVNTNALSTDLKILEEDEGVKFIFPDGFRKLNGEIYFFCPSAQSDDFKIKIGVDEENEQFVPTATLRKGLWKIKVDWYGNDKAYFKEEALVL